VLTREYLSVTVSGTLKWRIVDIRKFYLLLSRELRTTADHVHTERTDYLTPGDREDGVIDGEARIRKSITNRVALAITWLRVLTEEQTRFALSRVSSGLLIADRLANDMPEIRAVAGEPRDSSLLNALASAPPQAANPEWSGTTDGLARCIFDTLRARVDPYGILIEDVSLREVALPPEIIVECTRAAKAAYLPLLAQRQAAADLAVKRAGLAAEVELLGRDAVAAREIAAVAPAFTLADFLNDVVRKGVSPQGAAGLVTSAATIGMVGGPASAAAVQTAPASASSPESALRTNDPQHGASDADRRGSARRKRKPKNPSPS
jgi:hypothetical protein